MTRLCLVAVLAITGLVTAVAVAQDGRTDGDAAAERVRQAEARYEAALNAAESRLKQAHEQFQKSVAEARKKYLTEIRTERAGVESPTAPSSTKPVGEFKNLPISVPGGVPQELAEGADSVWTEVPKIAQGSVIFVPPGDARADGVVRFTVERDALIGLAASWAYDGNASGGWLESRKSKQQLIDEGWTEVGTMYRGLYDRHTILFRRCKKGEEFGIRTRKYRAPYVFVPFAVENQKPPASTTVDPKTAVAVPGAEVKAADEFIRPEVMPAELEGTLVHDSGTSGVAIVHVHKKTPVYVAASWNYDGNASGQWQEEAWSREEFTKNGWKEIGSVLLTHRGNEQKHSLFVRTCETGERFRLRTRKYGAPFVFVPRSG